MIYSFDESLSLPLLLSRLRDPCIGLVSSIASRLMAIDGIFFDFFLRAAFADCSLSEALSSSLALSPGFFDRLLDRLFDLSDFFCEGETLPDLDLLLSGLFVTPRVFGFCCFAKELCRPWAGGCWCT